MSGTGEPARNVDVVLLNWNERDRTERCLAAVQASVGVRTDVLVVDNGSEADDAERFRALLGADRVLVLPENRGYAGGMNAGLAFWRERATGNPVLIVTPDAAPPPSALAALLDELEETPEAGIVGPLVVYSRETGRVGAGGTIDAARVSAPLLSRTQATSPYDADWIDGCCMLVRHAVLDDLPEGFDERFFIYYEETDFCGRARAAGWRVRVVPAVEVDHPKSEGTLPPYYFYYMVRNRYLFWRKNHGTPTPRVAWTVLLDTLRACGSVVKSVLIPSRRREWRARLRDARLQLRAARVGTLDHLRGRYGRMPAARMPPAGD